MSRTHLVNIDAYKITVLSDGTTTQTEVTARGPFGSALAIGKGESRRRKGDRTRHDVGELLAMARMFEDAAKNARNELKALGYGDVA